MITYNKQKQFNNIYNNLYKKKLEFLHLDPKKYMLTLGLILKPISKLYTFDSMEEFYEVYFDYLNEYFEFNSLLDTYEYYEDLYNDFVRIMKDELNALHLSENDIWELYVNRTIYNFYKGFVFELSVIDIIDEDKLIHRVDDGLDKLIDMCCKIDIEFSNKDNKLMGIQCKTNTYLNISPKTQSYHISCMSKYIKEFGAETTYYLLHDSNNQPMKLASTNTYLIPYKEITKCSMNDFIIGSFKELEKELNNL